MEITEEQQNFIVHKVLPVITKLPAPKPVYRDDMDSSKIRCAACNTWHHHSVFNFIKSPININVLVPLCSTCAPDFRKLARIVCCTCKVVVGWLPPHKEKTGFIFEPDGIYHAKACPVCKPDLKKADILEKIIYFKENNIPYE